MINNTAGFLRVWYIHNMSNNTVMKYVMKPAICGIVGKLAASALIGVDGSGSLPFAGMDWAPSTVIGISVAGATVAAAANQRYRVHKGSVDGVLREHRKDNRACVGRRLHDRRCSVHSRTPG